MQFKCIEGMFLFFWSWAHFIAFAHVCVCVCVCIAMTITWICRTCHCFIHQFQVAHSSKKKTFIVCVATPFSTDLITLHTETLANVMLHSTSNERRQSVYHTCISANALVVLNRIGKCLLHRFFFSFYFSSRCQRVTQLHRWQPPDCYWSCSKYNYPRVEKKRKTMTTIITEVKI